MKNYSLIGERKAQDIELLMIEVGADHSIGKGIV